MREGFTNAALYRNTKPLRFGAFKLALLALLIFNLAAFAAPKLGKVKYIEGKAVLEQAGKTKNLRVNMRLKYGDKIITAEETRVEVQFLDGSVVRIAESSEIFLAGKPDFPAPQVKKGKLWANIQKMKSGQFVVQTEAATAAVRGTVFRVESTKDSLSIVALYNGAIDVGPKDTTSIAPKSVSKTTAQGAPQKGNWGPPKEVSGPSEVSLEEWVRLDPGQMIEVNWNGKYSVSDIPADQAAQNSWIQFNQQRDSQIERQKQGSEKKSGELEW